MPLLKAKKVLSSVDFCSTSELRVFLISAPPPLYIVLRFMAKASSAPEQ